MIQFPYMTGIKAEEDKTVWQGIVIHEDRDRLGMVGDSI